MVQLHGVACVAVAVVRATAPPCSLSPSSLNLHEQTLACQYSQSVDFVVDGVATRRKLRATCRITRRKHMHAAARGQRKRMQRLLVNVRHTATSQHPQNKIHAEALHQNAEAKQNGKAFYKRGRGLTWSSWSSCGDNCLQWCWNSTRTL